MDSFGGAGIKSFSLGGLASGMDTGAIISQLVAIERVPITRLQTQEAEYTAKLTLYQDMNSRVAGIKTATDALKNEDLYKSRVASTSDSSILSAVSDKTAAPGTYEVVVKQLGTASSLGSTGSVTYLDPTKSLSDAGYRKSFQWVTRTVDEGGTPRTGEGAAFSINGTSIDIWKTDTLDQVLNKINTQVSGVTASYDQVKDKIVLTKTGGGTMTVTDQVGNFLETNGFARNQVGTDTMSSSSRLAKNVSLTSKLASAFSGPVTDGVMSINGIAIAVNPNDSVQQMLDKINRSAAGVNASFSTTSNSFTLTAKEFGSKNIVLGNDSSGFVAAAKLSTATTNLGKFTVVSVDGTDFERSTTKITDVIQGVTLDLKKIATEVGGVPQPVRVTVTQDTKKLKDALAAVHEAYNKFVDFAEENSKGPEFDGTRQTGAAGALLGDFALNSIVFDLKRAFSNQVSGLPSNLNDFGDVGLTIGDLFSPNASRSKLHFEEDKLLQALRDDPSGVEKLFTQKDSGLADKMEKLFLSLTDGPGSTMESTIALQNQKIKDVQKRIDDQELRVERKRLDLLNVFTQMEKSMSQIQNQGNSLITTLNQQLGALSGSDK